jgi:hypothetical protein
MNLSVLRSRNRLSRFRRRPWRGHPNQWPCDRRPKIANPGSADQSHSIPDNVRGVVWPDPSMALLSRDRTICGRLFAAQRVRKTRLKGSTEQVQHIVIRPAGDGSLDRLARVRGGRAESSYGDQGFEYVFLGRGVMSKRCCRFRANRSWTITAFSLAGTLWGHPRQWLADSNKFAHSTVALCAS